MLDLSLDGGRLWHKHSGITPRVMGDIMVFKDIFCPSSLDCWQFQGYYRLGECIFFYSFFGNGALNDSCKVFNFLILSHFV